MAYICRNGAAVRTDVGQYCLSHEANFTCTSTSISCRTPYLASQPLFVACDRFEYPCTCRGRCHILTSTSNCIRLLCWTWSRWSRHFLHVPWGIFASFALVVQLSQIPGHHFVIVHESCYGNEHEWVVAFAEHSFWHCGLWCISGWRVQSDSKMFSCYW